MLAEDIEVAQIINLAASSKVTSRSRRDSVVFGGVIGLLIGLIVALYLGLRQPARPVRTRSMGAALRGQRAASGSRIAPT